MHWRLSEFSILESIVTITFCQVLIVPNRRDIPRLRRHRSSLRSNQCLRRLAKQKQMEVPGSVWVLLGGISQVGSEDLKEFWRWSVRSAEWAWKSAPLSECFLPNRQGSWRRRMWFTLFILDITYRGMVVDWLRIITTSTHLESSILQSALFLDYYSHLNQISFKVITTRSFDERLDTISAVRDAGISVCSGGILGLGESDSDRVGLIYEVSKWALNYFTVYGIFTQVLYPRSMSEHPESFPVNALVPIAGTPLEKNDVRTQRFFLTHFLTWESACISPCPHPYNCHRTHRHALYNN